MKFERLLKILGPWADVRSVWVAAAALAIGAVIGFSVNSGKDQGQKPSAAALNGERTAMSPAPEHEAHGESPAAVAGSRPSPDSPADLSAAGLVDLTASEGLIYTCPMTCLPPRKEPGHCPICGMELIGQVQRSDTSGETVARLDLSPEAIHLAGIQVTPAARQFVEAEIRLFGQIDYDTAHKTEISAFMPGVIDRVYIKRTGKFVRWGAPLFDIYSSDLLQAQLQLLEAMKHVPSFLAFQGSTPHVAQEMPVVSRRASTPSADRTPEEEKANQTISALRHKLSILGLPKRDIDEFMKVGEATGIATVYAPMYGQVTAVNALEGTYVNTGTPLFTLADPEYVWVRMEAYEADYPWIREGQPVSFTTVAYPGETFEAKVVNIDPVFNSRTRTFGVGAICTQDQGGRLKAGMLARAVIHARLTAGGKLANTDSPKDQAPLVIHAQAPILTGKRALVYVTDPQRPGSFEGREITLGPRAKDHYVVREGLTEGELVVVNGNFKIDSAMHILAKPSAMAPAGGHAVNGHGHGDMAATPAALTGADPLPPPVEMGSDASQPAAGHHRPGDSEVMNEEYSHKRLRSRMENMEGPAAEAEGDDAAAAAFRNRLSPHADQKEPDKIQRRRPGVYGDTTRSGVFSPEARRAR
jgi:Cu(I)/Ag(I) efflux system membrane fusion protein